MATAVNPKGKITKRSSNSYSGDEWRRHRPLITRLYSEEGRTLKEVCELLAKEYDFAPTERMYKSRLHTWGLDKKKKEHEMLDLVRQGLMQGGVDKNKVFMVRGKQISLADALHYFNRKGIKDPTSLLENSPESQRQRDLSSPEDYDVLTPQSSKQDSINLPNPFSESDHDPAPSPEMDVVTIDPGRTEFLKVADLASARLRQLCDQFGYEHLEPLPQFRTIQVESYITGEKPADAEAARYLDAVFSQTQAHFRDIFSKREITLNSSHSSWTTTSDASPSDQFYYLMYHGYSYLWNDQKQQAFEKFQEATAMIGQLLREKHVSFLIYIFDLIIRHDGTNCEEPLLLMLQQLTELSWVVFQDAQHPTYLIASWLLNAPPHISRAWICLSTMRKLLDFFQDSIGYFHGETVALLQMFATGLLNKKHYRESAVRFQQLADAIGTTQTRHCYDTCYALRSASEAYFYAGDYRESLRAIQMALEYSKGISYFEEREIHVRCLRALAEISNATNHRDEAIISIGYVVEICAAAFGPEHTYTKRARMHQKSLRKGESLREGALPPMVYRLGRGGDAAKHVWTTRCSPTRLQGKI